jgi:hypothetical protein
MYQVPNMVLIPQDNNNACWYASAQMVVRWRREADRMSSMLLRGPGQVSTFAATHAANSGLSWVQMREFARQLGLQPLPLMTPSPETLQEWLTRYGPIWTDGVPVNAAGTIVGHGHVVVLAGIRASTSSGEHFDLLIYDPWPPNVGDVRWRPGSHLSLIQSGVATSPIRNVSFLVAPSQAGSR